MYINGDNGSIEDVRFLRVTIYPLFIIQSHFS